MGDVFVSASPTVNLSLEGSANGNWVSTYDQFGTSPLVLGYNPASRFATALKTEPWYDVVDLPGFLLGPHRPRDRPQGRAGRGRADRRGAQLRRPGARARWPPKRPTCSPRRRWWDGCRPGSWTPASSTASRPPRRASRRCRSSARAWRRSTPCAPQQRAARRRGEGLRRSSCSAPRARRSSRPTASCQPPGQVGVGPPPSSTSHDAALDGRRPRDGAPTAKSPLSWLGGLIVLYLAVPLVAFAVRFAHEPAARLPRARTALRRSRSRWPAPPSPWRS